MLFNVLRIGPGALQRRHLVVHQRDQRRDDDGQAIREDGRQLVAERLAAAGGHQHQRIAAIQDMLNRLPLLRSERVVPVRVPERGVERVRRH